MENRKQKNGIGNQTNPVGIKLGLLAEHKQL